MNKFLAAKKSNGTQIFFVFDEDFDGLLVNGSNEEKIPFWSFISKSNDVYLLTETELQQELASMKWQDSEWLRKFCAKDADFIIAANKAYNQVS